MSAYVVRTEFPSRDAGQRFWRSLQGGRARIGWSYDNTLDLKMIVDETNIGQWRKLSAPQQAAWYCHGFIDRALAGDLLFYPHVPERNHLIIVRLTDGPYRLLDESEAIEQDFRSARPCEVLTRAPVSMDDAIVPIPVRHKLGLQRRFYELKDEQAVSDLVAKLSNAGNRLAATPLERLAERVAEHRTQAEAAFATDLARQFPTHRLSEMVHLLFRANGDQTDYQEGRSENGSDIVLSIDNPVLLRPMRVGIQVKAYSGNVSPQELQRALTQLLNGWEANRLDAGALVITGDINAAAREVLNAHNRENHRQPVRLLDAAQITRLAFQVYYKEGFGEPTDWEASGSVSLSGIGNS